MGEIAYNIERVREHIPQHVDLVCVTKTKPVDMLQEAYQAGERLFGENKVQEMVDKHDQLPKDIQWHMIGHLQRNKVKYIAPFVSLIHSVDSEQLLTTINKEAEKNERTIPCLLQFHIAQEETKFGFSLEEAETFLKQEKLAELTNVEIVGVMGMASFVDNEQQIKAEFSQLKEIFTYLKENYFLQNNSFHTLSMGMSGDYQLAIEQGSTMVRVGSAIFGERNYKK